MSRIAIPWSRQHIAPHFSRADGFRIVDEAGAIIADVPNPIVSQECHQRHQLLKVFQQYSVTDVIVRRVGSRMLGRLLSEGFAVHISHQAEPNMQQLLQLPELTDAMQGGPSPHHEHKQCHEGSGHQCRNHGHEGAGHQCRNHGSAGHECRRHADNPHTFCCHGEHRH